MRATAARRGIDLTAHASRTITGEAVAAAETILLFDLRNYSEFKRAFPQHMDKVLMLGLFRREPHLTIEDPYGMPEEEAGTVVEEIAEAVAGLAAFGSRSAPRADGKDSSRRTD